MKASLLHSMRSAKAFTLVEVTLVISILLGLIVVLFVGVAAYKKGSDRANCIQNIASVQKAVRSFSNLYSYGSGDTVTNLKDAVIGPGKFFEADPVCRSGGTYAYGGDTIPLAGIPYLNCNLPDHVPTSVAGW